MYYLAITHKKLKNGNIKELASYKKIWTDLTLNEARTKMEYYKKYSSQYIIRIFKDNWEVIE